ncbi:SDR family NAD(P)-dependent oxidoreductase [Lentilitoribacter sp. EG35]|uniref:SDR family NAD(P)-dependent oxidoreductase n=1 Tax=Lentilitoribacter sp. EG35 TaxID=3234192 RepID=UPI003461042A
MSIYNASPSDGVAWVTGASSGIGRSVALQLCSEGYNVVATARSVDKLEALKNEASNLRGEIITCAGDVTDAASMSDIVGSITNEHGVISLVILNAGVYIPVSGNSLKIEDFQSTFSVNLYGVVNGMVPAIEAMKTQGWGQVAIVSSVTGYGGLPTSAAYGATKAAVINMAESLKFDLDKLNIRIQVINPGFVKTAATDQNDFKMPAIIPAEEAAKRISEGLKKDCFEITFPKRFTYVLKFLNLLPYKLYFALVGMTSK